jgi:hypothetical protein
VSYASDPIGTIASFTAAGAFVAIVLGVAAERSFDHLEAWVARGVFFGGIIGLAAIILDALR